SPRQLRKVLVVDEVHVIERCRIKAQQRPQFTARELADMRAHSQTMLVGGLENHLSVSKGKGATLDKDIYKLRQLFLGGLRNHLLADFFNVLCGLIAKFFGNRMRAEQRGNYCSGPLFRGPLNRLERFELGLNS